MDLTKEPAAHLSGYVFYGGVTNSCHKGNQKPKWISPRNQLLICLGMCFMVGSPTAVKRGMRTQRISLRTQLLISLGMCSIVSQVDLPQEPAAYLLRYRYVFYGRVSNSCHKGTEKPPRISPRSQLLICLGMCCMVGS